MPKVSIIIPIYKVEAYLARAVESALGQSERDIEIILVDDGSPDACGTICDRYAEADSRVKVIHQANGGLSAARNAGLAQACGAYVLFLDGDDYLSADAVEILLAAAERYPSDYIQFHYREVREDGTPIGDAAAPPLLQIDSARGLADMLYSFGGVAASACTKLIRRELAEQFPYEPLMHEDEMWCTRVLLHAAEHPLRVTCIPDLLYHYVIREDSIIHSRFNRRKLDAFVVAEARIRALESLGYTDLLGIAYAKLFSTILGLYCAAKSAGDSASLAEIKAAFFSQKKSIKRHAKLTGRFLLLFGIMDRCYAAIYFYYIFRTWRVTSN